MMLRYLSILLAVIALPQFVAHADILHLRNGNEMEGIILEESEGKVVLGIGVGKVTIQRSQIARIERGESEDQREIRRDWKKKYFDHPLYAPEGLEDISREFKALESDRQAALRAEQEGRLRADRVTALETELTRLEAAHVAVSRQLRGARPQADLARYNELATRSNALQSGIVVKRAELEQARSGQPDARRPVYRYLNKLEALGDRLAERQAGFADQPPNEEYAYYFSRMDDRLRSYWNDFKVTNVKPVQRGGNVVLAVRINDMGDGLFIFDTGASLVTISRALAERLRIPASAGERVQVGLADGQVLEARMVALASLQVGEARAEEVSAVILPNPPAAGVDGLLGMSFLENFNFRYNPAENQLVLQEFTARE